MASIENRSKFKVTVQNRSDLTHRFDYNDKNGLKAHLESLQQHGFKPKLSRLNDTFAVRVRQVGRAPQTLFAKTEEEAVAIKLHLEAQHRQGLFIDYGKARRVTLGEVLSRYLREEGPRHIIRRGGKHRLAEMLRRLRYPIGESRAPL